MHRLLHFGACVCLVVAFAGCRLISDEAVVQGRSPLQPAPASPDSVAMEIIWARFPAGDPSLNIGAWEEIDETQIEPAVQRELANNGFRAGVIGVRLPEAINRALHQGEDAAEPAGDSGEEQVRQLTTEPVVRGRIQRLRRNQRSEIQASETFDSLPLLVSGRRELSGEIFQQAQAIYALRVDPRPDRTVDIELTPEIHHGQPRLRWANEVGVGLRQAPLRDREVFERMRIAVRLSPGEMLVLMSLPDAGSRLGHYFHHVDSADGAQQKLILIRLAEVPSTDTFTGP